jgi:hypothetical protein
MYLTELGFLHRDVSVCTQQFFAIAHTRAAVTDLLFVACLQGGEERAAQLREASKGKGMVCVVRAENSKLGFCGA